VWPSGWGEVWLYSSVTAALEGGEWWAARCGRTLPPRKARYPFYRRLGGPQGRSGRAEKSRPHRDSIPVQSVVTRYTDWATRPIYKNSILNETNYSIERTGTVCTCGQCLNFLCYVAILYPGNVKLVDIPRCLFLDWIISNVILGLDYR